MPAVTAESLVRACRSLLNLDPPPAITLRDYLDAIPGLGLLAELPSGTPVLVRGDVDAKPGDQVGEGDIRLRSMAETLEYGRRKGWKQIVFGHVGRKPEGSLKKIAARLGQILGCEVPLVTDWLDEGSLSIKEAAAKQIAAAAPGSVLMLENTRAYAIETILWSAEEQDLPAIADKLARFANEMGSKVARHYVNEALSAGSLDTSSTIVPLAMEQAVLGRYVAGEFQGPMMRCLEAQLVIFSGIKIDKLDDLEAMIERGTVRTVISAGSLALALAKANADLAGKSFSLGKSGAEENKKQGFYIPQERIEQAKRILESGRQKGIRFVLPVDFVLEDGSVVSELGPSDQQFDVGPKSSELYEKTVGEFIAESKQHRRPVAFHNGVFGMFEKEEFSHGTRKFISELKRLKEAGVEVYVGGGEGGTALEQYGQSDWVTHTFTAGGTVLNALGSNPVPYLVTLRRVALGR